MIFCACVLLGASAPYYNQDTLSSLKHQVNNQEVELKSLEQRVENFQNIVDHLRDQLQTSLQAQKEQIKGHSSNTESDIGSLKKTVRDLAEDIKKLQEHANSSATTLNTLKQKLVDWDQQMQVQQRNIDQLHAGLDALADALGAKSTPIPATTLPANSYRIKSGDSLEKIAKAHQTTIQAIKELNNMTSDKIVEGKVIRVR